MSPAQYVRLQISVSFRQDASNGDRIGEMRQLLASDVDMRGRNTFERGGTGPVPLRKKPSEAIGRSSMLTTAEQRTRAVREARWLLEIISEGEEIDVPGLVPTLAGQLLRWFPDDSHLRASFEKLPEIWGEPDAKR